MPVNTQHPSYTAGMKKASLVEDMYYQPRSITSSGKYLVKEPNESEEAFAARVKRSRLYNFFSATVDSLAGMAFSTPVTVNGLPDELLETVNNFNGSGRSITSVAHEIFVYNLLYGYCAMLTEAPVLPENATVADAKNHLPYGVVVPPKSLFAWHTEYRNGKTETGHLRYSYSAIEQGGVDEFDYDVNEYINAVYPDRTDVYKRTDTGGVKNNSGAFIGEGNGTNESWELVEPRPNELGYIPVTTSYTEYDGDYIMTVPLDELAELNKYHYQSLSDQVNILRIARVPFLLATGFADNELEGVSLGVNRMIATTKPDADIKFIEHQGNSIDAGYKDLEGILDFAEKVGAKLLSSNSVSRQTAKARTMDQGEALSVIQLTLRDIEKQLYDHYQICGDYVGVDCSDVKVALGIDLTIPVEPNPINSLMSMVDSGFDPEVVVDEGKRRGVLSDKVTASNITVKSEPEPQVAPSPAITEGDVNEEEA